MKPTTGIAAELMRAFEHPSVIPSSTSATLPILDWAVNAGMSPEQVNYLRDHLLRMDSLAIEIRKAAVQECAADCAKIAVRTGAVRASRSIRDKYGVTE